jgi:dihydrofolate reductase
MGGDMSRQCLTAGLLDEIDIDLVPAILGEGWPLFDGLDASVDLELTRVVERPA